MMAMTDHERQRILDGLFDRLGPILNEYVEAAGLTLDAQTENALSDLRLDLAFEVNRWLDKRGIDVAEVKEKLQMAWIRRLG
jgi:hypothetical protein